MKKISTIRWGVILIGVGLSALAINMGYLDNGFWFRLISFWPVLLIAVGIEFMFTNTRAHWLGLLSPVLIALTFLYLVF